MAQTFRITLLFVLLVSGTLLSAQEPVIEKAVAPAGPSGGVKRALLICGLSGDAQHHKSFAETMTKLHSVLTTKLGFAASDVEVLFGDEPQPGEVEPIQSAARATRAELETRTRALREKLRPEDTVWVFVLGHSHYDGQFSWLNLPGSDLHQVDFAKLFEGIPANEQVFVLTTPTSGFYIKPLSSKNRIIVTATEADWETNETEYAQELARILSSPPPAKELDVDLDGQVTLFDIHVSVARNLAQSYKDRELLATEHPLLDDNGDSRGTEVQIDYLIAELGGRAKPTNFVAPVLSSAVDGYRSKLIRLPIGD